MNTSRRAFAQLAAFTSLCMSVGAVWAAPPVIEIIAFAHPPVQSALKPLRDWLATQGNKIRVLELDMETPAGVQRAAAVGVTGHVPILLLINGRYAFTRKDGSPVEFKSFPAGLGAPGPKGAWTIDDAKAVIVSTH